MDTGRDPSAADSFFSVKETKPDAFGQPQFILSLLDIHVDIVLKAQPKTDDDLINIARNFLKHDVESLKDIKMVNEVKRTPDEHELFCLGCAMSIFENLAKAGHDEAELYRDLVGQRLVEEREWMGLKNALLKQDLELAGYFKDAPITAEINAQWDTVVREVERSRSTRDIKGDTGLEKLSVEKEKLKMLLAHTKGVAYQASPEIQEKMKDIKAKESAIQKLENNLLRANEDRKKLQGLSESPRIAFIQDKKSEKINVRSAEREFIKKQGEFNAVVQKITAELKNAKADLMRLESQLFSMLNSKKDLKFGITEKREQDSSPTIADKKDQFSP